MDKRAEIAIKYENSKHWIGGAYYIQNLIKALNTVDDSEKPFIYIYCSNEEDYHYLIKETCYPYSKYVHEELNMSLFSKIKDIVKAIFDFYNFKSSNAIDLSGTDILFLYPAGNPSKVKDLKRSLGWIPDFQELHLPQLFSWKERVKRKMRNRLYAKSGMSMVFSSYDSVEDFRRFYPYSNCHTYVMHFAVTHPDFSDVNEDEVRMKYGIKGDYLFCANQFWEHKNHLMLFKAFKLALDKGFKCQLVCSGTLEGKNNHVYSNTIKKYIEDNDLNEKIKILGFIDRKEQLCLMKNSYAIVQPSLFEGWSTVVEDAKLLNKFIFLSNLKVHLEQSPTNVCYFNPNNENELAGLFLTVKPEIRSYDYSDDIKKFGKTFVQIINDYKANQTT